MREVLGVLGASTATRTNAWGSNCGTRIRHVCAQIEFCQVVLHVDILFVRLLSGTKQREAEHDGVDEQ